MEKLSKYLIFIKENHLEAAGKESMRLVFELKLPLMKLFVNMPEEVLLEQSMKSIGEFAENLADSSYFVKQQESLKLWEEDKIPGIPPNAIEPSDLVLIYTLQKKWMLKFLPLYTSDVQLAADIINELEDLHSNSQIAGINVLFKKQVKTEEEMKRTNNFLNTILDNIPNMVFVKNAENLRFVRFNKAGEELLGYSKEELIGKNDFDFFPKEQADFFTEKDREVLKNGTLKNIKEELVDTRNKGQRWLHTKKIPIKDEKGNVLFLLGISEDITEQKKSEDAIVSLNKELEAFTYSVSHDLRAPLRAVSGYSNMLEEDCGKKLGVEGKRILGVIKYNAEKMGHLIDDLLAFARLGKKEIEKIEENMHELVEGVLLELNKLFSHHAEIKIGKLHKVKTDYGLMHQVMLNLISNAIKYSSKKKNPVIEINSRKSGGEIIFCVKDNGVGFDMRYVGKLFGVFQRLHSSEEFEGTGVGLAIVQRIIAKHHGRVWAEGKINGGAAFYIALPI